MKLWGKIKKEWKKQMVETRNFPIKSKNLIGDLYITALGFFIIGASFAFAFMYFDRTGDIKHFVTATFICISLGGATIFNFYYWTYRQMKAYENRYGSTKLGDQWLQKRQLKSKQ